MRKHIVQTKWLTLKAQDKILQHPELVELLQNWLIVENGKKSVWNNGTRINTPVIIEKIAEYLGEAPDSLQQDTPPPKRVNRIKRPAIV